MEGAHARHLAQRLQRDLFFAMGFEIAADALDQRRRSRLPIRFAAQAGAQAGPFGRLRRIEEADTLSPGPLRRARWPAVNSGAGYAKDKLAIGGSVPVKDRLPASFHRARGRRSGIGRFRRRGTGLCPEAWLNPVRFLCSQLLPCLQPSSLFHLRGASASALVELAKVARSNLGSAL